MIKNETAIGTWLTLTMIRNAAYLTDKDTLHVSL